MKINKIMIVISVLIFGIVSCKVKAKLDTSNNQVNVNNNLKTLVYKTKKDYQYLVPIFLSDDKTKVISYPHPSDLKNEENYFYPTLLKKGYLLDNKGIGKNIAFIRYTYEEYVALNSIPTLDDFLKLIIDDDPLEELCDCGDRHSFADVEKDINQMIKKKRLRKDCIVIK